MPAADVAEVGGAVQRIASGRYGPVDGEARSTKGGSRQRRLDAAQPLAQPSHGLRDDEVVLCGEVRFTRVGARSPAPLIQSGSPPRSVVLRSWVSLRHVYGTTKHKRVVEPRRPDLVRRPAGSGFPRAHSDQTEHPLGLLTWPGGRGLWNTLI